MCLTSEQLSELKPLVVAVVGPTNEGKTSLLRTLTNDPDFGHVNAFTGTTVRAEIQKVFYRGIAEILQLIDTPGFQTSSEIMERGAANTVSPTFSTRFRWTTRIFATICARGVKLNGATSSFLSQTSRKIRINRCSKIR